MTDSETHVGQNDLVRLDITDGVATVELTNGRRANSMGAAMFDQLVAALDRAVADRTARSILLCGEGRHFCAGGDLDHPLFSETDENERRVQISAAYEVTKRLIDASLPVVTAVQGRCAGAALALILASDLCIAADSTVLSLDFVKLGLAPDMGVTWLLGNVVGTRRALDLALTGEPIDAATALDWGIVSRVVGHDEERRTARDVCEQLGQFAPGGLAATRRLVRAAPHRARDDAFRSEIDTMTALTPTPDVQARLNAFRKRTR